MSGLLMLVGCASDSGSQRELSELKAELRAQRETNQRLESRIERLEDAQAVFTARAQSKAQPAAQKPDGAVPELTVVKLKPKAEPAPKIDTRVAVVEPPPEVFSDLNTPQSGDDDQPAAASSQQSSQQTAELLDAQFNEGLESLKTGNVEGGILKLQTFAAQNPRHQKADNALYFAGVGLMGVGDPDGAARMFNLVVAGYPAGDATVDAMLKLAECRVKLNQTSDAKALYSRVVESYPGTPAATQAQQRLAALH
ncbi:MAG: tetratricopeptide repeat protein [Myxococcaceae bacterium]